MPPGCSILMATILRSSIKARRVVGWPPLKPYDEFGCRILAVFEGAGFDFSFPSLLTAPRFGLPRALEARGFWYLGLDCLGSPTHFSSVRTFNFCTPQLPRNFFASKSSQYCIIIWTKQLYVETVSYVRAGSALSTHRASCRPKNPRH